jgi:hypothetical protein
VAAARYSFAASLMLNVLTMSFTVDLDRIGLAVVETTMNDWIIMQKSVDRIEIALS